MNVLGCDLSHCWNYTVNNDFESDLGEHPQLIKSVYHLFIGFSIWNQNKKWNGNGNPLLFFLIFCFQNKNDKTDIVSFSDFHIVLKWEMEKNG